MRKSKRASKLTNPPKKHIEVKEGPSTNLDASVQTDQLLETGPVLAPAPATCSPSSPAVRFSPSPRVPLPAARQRQTQVGLSPQAGLPVVALTVHEQPSQALPRLARVGLSPAPFYTSRLTEPGRGSHRRIVTGRVGGCPLPRKPLILCLPASCAPTPAALAQTDSGKDMKRGAGLLSMADHDPGKYHLAFLCVF